MSTCLVTGGGGFLGYNLCKSLIEKGFKVISLSRNNYKKLDELGVIQIKHDLRFPIYFNEKYKEIDAIFHTAAKVGMWGDYYDFYETNVLGTRYLLKFALDHNINKFIYTSSPSVISNGKDLLNVNESIKYPFKYNSFYPMTKAEAEKMVLGYNCDNLKTISLRPHLIFGPGDTNLIPTIIKKAKAGNLKIIGDGKNLVDFSFITDCVNAHINAYYSLNTNTDCSGKAYFISQGEPFKLWEFINIILEKNNIEPVDKYVNKSLAKFVAFVSEKKSRFDNSEPYLTRFLVEQMADSHYFDISNAKVDLGYSPIYSMKEALEII